MWIHTYYGSLNTFCFNNYISHEFPHTGHEVADGTLPQRLWLDLINDGTWEHSGSSAEYTKWDSENPDLDDDDRCAVMNYETETWQDADCSSVFGFICEFEGNIRLAIKREHTGLK